MVTGGLVTGLFFAIMNPTSRNRFIYYYVNTGSVLQ